MEKKIKTPKYYAQMKKTMITILIFLFASTAVNYAKISTTDPPGDRPTRGIGFFSSDPGTIAETTDDSGTGFFRSSDPDEGRPGGDTGGDGGGIGQEAPIHDGLQILVGFSIALAVFKAFNEKRKSTAGR